AFCVDLVHLQAERRLPLVPHPARHADSLEHPRGCGTAADRARSSVFALRAMPSAEAREAVALHDPCGALALRRCRDIDQRTFGEQVGIDLAADLVAISG